jgi:hypothetical protein
MFDFHTVPTCLLVHNDACAAQLLVHSFAGTKILVEKYTLAGKIEQPPTAILSQNGEVSAWYYDTHVMISAIFAHLHIMTHESIHVTINDCDD